MANIFVDYVPEGEDAGALDGGKGYSDFVPDREPELKSKKEIESSSPELTEEDMADLGVKPEVVKEVKKGKK